MTSQRIEREQQATYYRYGVIMRILARPHEQYTLLPEAIGTATAAIVNHQILRYLLSSLGLQEHHVREYVELVDLPLSDIARFDMESMFDFFAGCIRHARGFDGTSFTPVYSPIDGSLVRLQENDGLSEQEIASIQSEVRGLTLKQASKRSKLREAKAELETAKSRRLRIRKKGDGEDE